MPPGLTWTHVVIVATLVLPTVASQHWDSPGIKIVQPTPDFNSVTVTKEISLTEAERRYILADVDADGNDVLSANEVEAYEVGTLVIQEQEGPDRLRRDDGRARQFARWTDLGQFEGSTAAWNGRTVTDTRVYDFHPFEETPSTLRLEGEPEVVDETRDFLVFRAPQDWLIVSLNGQAQGDAGANEVTYSDDEPYVLQFGVASPPPSPAGPGADADLPGSLAAAALAVAAMALVIAGFAFWHVHRNRPDSRDQTDND